MPQISDLVFLRHIDFTCDIETRGGLGVSVRVGVSFRVSDSEICWFDATVVIAMVETCLMSTLDPKPYRLGEDRHHILPWFLRMHTSSNCRHISTVIAPCVLYKKYSRCSTCHGRYGHTGRYLELGLIMTFMFSLPYIPEVCAFLARVHKSKTTIRKHEMIADFCRFIFLLVYTSS